MKDPLFIYVPRVVYFVKYSNLINIYISKSDSALYIYLLEEIEDFLNSDFTFIEL